MVRRRAAVSAKPAQKNPFQKLRAEYGRYLEFISLRADRYKILLEHIRSLNLNHYVITIAGNRHIFIFPPGKKLPRIAGDAFPFYGKSPCVLTAHYDRVAGSPGANDNSIALFHLLCAAKDLIQQGAGNWMIIFTDKEELRPGESFDKQGSYTLGQKLKAWGLGKARLFNFDVCGCGNALVISTTADILLQEGVTQNIRSVREDIVALRNKVLETANHLGAEKFMLAPVPFSDDAGFLRAGIASQTITVLPAEEADKYEALLRSRPDFAQLIISGGIKEPAEKRRLPQTWQRLNSTLDTHLHLTPQYFENVVDFMVELCV